MTRSKDGSLKMQMNLRRKRQPSRSSGRGSVVRTRRGFALLTVMLIAVVGAILALASGMLAMSNVLIQAGSDRAAAVDDAALSGLEVERSRMNAKLDTVPLSGYSTVESASVAGGITRTTWISRLGNSDSLSSTGEYGVQAEIVSKAVDTFGNVAIRRVQMYQESFARFASFTDKGKSTNGSTLWWALGAQAQGPVHSNDTIFVWNAMPHPQATFFDKVTTAKVVLNKTAADFRKGQPLERVAQIPMPTSADLDKLKSIAGNAGYVFTPDVVTGDSALATMRIEFLAIDTDGDGNTTGPNDGYFRVYKVSSATNPYGAGYAMARPPAPPTVGVCSPALAGCMLPAVVVGGVALDSMLYSNNCGVTAVTGPLTTMAATLRHTAVVGSATTYLSKMQSKDNAFDDAMTHCYLGGDERLNADGLFHPVDSAGYWVPRTSGNVPPAITARADGAYLWPLSPALNANFRGVIFAEGKVAVSGTVRGRITLASRAALVIAHDLRQATSPAIATGTCLPDDDIVGLFSGSYVVYADNLLGTPQWRVNSNGGASLNGTGYIWPRKDFDPSTGRPDMTIHASVLTLKSVVTENSSPPAGLPANRYVDRGTTRLIGGTIEQSSGQTGTMNGSYLHGYHDDLSFNQCALKYPPPYFPTTGHWTRTQFYEVNPQGFAPSTWFAGR
jgi:hypothetical protein